MKNGNPLVNEKLGKLKAPDFCLQNQDNKQVCLEDFKGKWLVLYFYPKDNSKTCTLEAIEFTENLKHFEKMDAVVIGVSPDSVKSHKNFAIKHQLNFSLLSDPEHELLEKFEVWKLKKMYGREYMGTERSTFIIDKEGYISADWRNVRIKGHIEAVKQKLLEMKSN